VSSNFIPGGEGTCVPNIWPSVHELSAMPQKNKMILGDLTKTGYAAPPKITIKILIIAVQ